MKKVKFKKGMFSLAIVLCLLAQTIPASASRESAQAPDMANAGQQGIDAAEAQDEGLAAQENQAAADAHYQYDGATREARETRKKVSFAAKADWMLGMKFNPDEQAFMAPKAPGWQEVRRLLECLEHPGACEPSPEAIIGNVARIGAVVNMDQGVFQQEYKLTFEGDGECRKTKGDRFFGMQKNKYEGTGNWTLTYLNSAFVGYASYFNGTPDKPVVMASEGVEAEHRTKTVCDSQLQGQKSLDKVSSKVDEYAYAPMAGPAVGHARLGYYRVPLVGVLIDIPLPTLHLAGARFSTPGGSPFTTFEVEGTPVLFGHDLEDAFLRGEGQTVAG